MTPLNLLVTNAGMAAFTAAQLDNDIDFTVSSVGVTAAAFAMAPTLTALPGETKRIPTVSGEVIGLDTVHLMVRDADPEAYTVRGFGLFLADGTLFAVYGQAPVLVEKSAQSTTLLALDLRFPVDMVAQIVFGDANFLNPPATETVAGVAEIATDGEVDAGEDDRRIVTSKKLARRLAAAIGEALTAALDPIQRAIAACVPQTRAISAGDGLTGGGGLDQDRTLAINEASPAELLDGEAAHKVATAAALGALAANFASTGEFALPGGILVKVVVKMGPFTEGAVNIPFVTPFPTACRIAVPVGINASGSTLRDIYLQEQALAPGSFTAFVQKAGSDGTNIDGVRVVAIGY